MTTTDTFKSEATAELRMVSRAGTVRAIVETAWPFAIFIGAIVFIISFVQENWVAVAIAIGIAALGVAGRQWLRRQTTSPDR